MIVSDLYLDREEEALYWEAVQRLGIEQSEAELLLLSTLKEYEATREKEIYQSLKVYLVGALRDHLLDFEEERSALHWLLQKQHIPTGSHKKLLIEVCEEQRAHVASCIIDEMLMVFKTRFQMPQWTSKQKLDAAQWATEYWQGLSTNQIWELVDAYLD